MIEPMSMNTDEYSARAGKSGRATLDYPSPFFDLAQTYFPDSIKELFQYCVYFYNTNCIIPAVVNKMAEYPITDLIFAADADKKELQDKWKKLFNEHLDMHRILHEAGLDLGVYGNCFMGVYLPFKRFLICPNCSATNQFGSCKDIKIKGKNLDVHGTCPSCGCKVKFTIKDKYIRSVRGINIIRYDPRSIEIVSDPVSGERYYVWQPPQGYLECLREGKDLAMFEHAPKIVLEAIAEDKQIKMRNNLFYHMKRPSLAGQSQSWGYPLVMHALKSLYYLQTLKRAQEAIAAQHIIPLWILFPQAANASSLPPAAQIGLSKWKARIEEELSNWRKDPNYIPIVNEPVGQVQLGGEGRALLLGPEIQQEVQQIIASMSVPQEFVFGGMTWTGSSITLRMLENCFTGIRSGMQRFIKFCVNVFSQHLRYQPIDIYMSELRMADDVQRQQIAMNLEAAGKISATRLLAEFGYDFNEENKLKKEEATAKSKDFIRESILQAKAQGEGQMEAFDYQIKQQLKQMQAEGDMQVAQAKAQAMAQQKMMELGIMPPPQEGQEGQGGEGEQGQEQGGEQQGQPQAQDQEQVDPQTGLPIDPNSGLPMDPETGLLVDIQNGVYLDPQSGQPVAPLDQGGQQGQGQEPIPPQEGEVPPQEGEVPPEMMGELLPEDQMPEEPVPEEPVPEKPVPEEQMSEEEIPPEMMGEQLPEEPVPEGQMPEEPVPGEQMPEEELPPEAYEDSGIVLGTPEDLEPQEPEQEIDPMTGLPIDPQSGLPFDPESGMLIDLPAECGILVNENVIIDLQTGVEVSPEEYMARKSADFSQPPQFDESLMQQPDYPTDLTKSGSLKTADLREENFNTARRQQQEEAVRQGIQTGQVSPSSKAFVTTLAKQLSGMSAVDRQNVLFELSKSMPAAAQLVKQRLGELSQIQPAVNPPASMDAQKYGPFNQSRGLHK